MAKEKLAPLAVDPSGKLSPATPSNAEPIAVAPEPAERTDPVSDWMDRNPEGKDFKEEAPAPKPSSDVPVVEDKKKEAASAAPLDAKPSESTPPTPKTGETAPPKTDAAPKIEPAAPVAKTYEPQERIALAEGTEWTREQIVAGLTERAKLQAEVKTYEPIKAEAEGFKQIFGMNASQAKEAWGPILSRLAQEPQTADFLDSYLQNPALAEYLNECAAHFAQQVPPATRGQEQRQPQKPAVDPVMQQQLHELQTWKNEQEKRSSDERVRNEWAQATARYPFLAHDNAAKQDLIATAQWMWSRDNSKGIMDALALKAPVYDRIGQLNSPPAAPVAQPVVPALLGSSGASPTATRTHNNRPRKVDDPVKDWIDNPPAQFAG